MGEINGLAPYLQSARMQQICKDIDWWENTEAGQGFILRRGEIGVALIEGQAPIIKVGDGLSLWGNLPQGGALEKGYANKSIIQPGNTAGTLGYYYSHIDLANSQIYLTTTRVIPQIGVGQIDTNFEAPTYEAGNRICITNGAKYDYNDTTNTAKVVSVTNNIITYEGNIGFTSIATEDIEGLSIDDYSLFVIEQPDVGIVEVRQGAAAFGVISNSLGLYSFAEGGAASAIGNYSHAEGLYTEANYASHAEGSNTKAYGQASHAEGQGTTALGSGSHAQGLASQSIGDYSHAGGTHSKANKGNSFAHGLNVIANKDRQFVFGQYNIQDTEDKYAHIIGWGWADNNRINIHTVDTAGNAWYKKDVYVGGTSQTDALKLATENYVEQQLISKITAEQAETIAKEEIRKIVEADNNGIIDKLSEIAEWIDNDQTGATKIVQDLSQAQTDIGQLQSQTATLNNSFGGLNTRITANEGAISDLTQQIGEGYMPEVGNDGDVVAVVDGKWQSSAVVSDLKNDVNSLVLDISILQTEIQELRDKLATVLNVTAADAGKILRVDTEGKWELAKLNSFEEATF